MYKDGPKSYSTCGMACASKLQAACDLPNANEPPTSNPPNLNGAFMSSSLPRNNTDITRSHSESRSNQTLLEMCDASTLIYDSDRKRTCLSYARYATSALDIKEKAKSTLLVDSAVLLNCKRLVPLKCVM